MSAFDCVTRHFLMPLRAMMPEHAMSARCYARDAMPYDDMQSLLRYCHERFRCDIFFAFRDAERAMIAPP